MLVVAVHGCGEALDYDHVPITTSSEEARCAYLESQERFDNLRTAEARAFALQAVELDDGFAVAHLLLAAASGRTSGFFEHLDRAVELSGEVSEAERHIILGFQAGSKGDLATQRQHYQQLVLTFPNDERAHHLLGGHFFLQQEWTQAIEHYRRAIELHPEFAAPYNQLGYALRSTGDYQGAEDAFREYVRLMPDEANPLDSYAELLMKRGRFEQSIDKYREALEKNPEFVPSYIGIGNNLLFLGEPAEARKTFSLLGEVASNDSERRQAVFWTVVSFIHEDRYDEALLAAEELHAMAYDGDDLLGASEALVLMGDVLLEAGSPEQAIEKYHAALGLLQASGSPDEIKRTAARKLMYHEARVALKVNDLEKAKTIANRYGDLVGEHQIPSERRSHRELVGLVALAEGDYDLAVSHLEKADQDDPRVLYELALAHRGASHNEKARELAEMAANWNGLGINFAYVRHKAREF